MSDPEHAALRRRQRRRLRLVRTVAVALAVVGVGVWALWPSSAPRPTAQHRSAPVPAHVPMTTNNVYAADGANMLSPVVQGVPYRLYAPDSLGDGVDVIDANTFRVIDHFRTGTNPQHVVPSWDLKTLYVTNDEANSLTPIDPHTGRPAGPNIPVNDPYNMYFSPDGSQAIVVAEAAQHLDFRDARTFQLIHSVPVTCAGVDHVDFAADGSYFIATCEFSGKLVKVDLRTQSVVGYLHIGGSPQDIKLDPQGQIFYVADKDEGGVHLIDAASFTEVGFIPTGRDTHGLYPSRDAKDMYVTNRGSGSVTLVDFATRQIVANWTIPGGGSPDMGNVSPDGKVLWLAARYNDVVYAFSTADGHLMAKIPVGRSPHGLCVWPQPGRYSLGHTGDLR